MVKNGEKWLKMVGKGKEKSREILKMWKKGKRFKKGGKWQKKGKK